MKFLRNLLGLEGYISLRKKYRGLKKTLGFKTVNDGFDEVKKAALGSPNPELPFGVNVIGYINSESGVGQNARGMIQALKHAKIPVSVCNFDTGWHRTDDTSSSEFSQKLPYAINLCCFNAEETPYRMHQLGAEKLKGKYNIGLWAWELDQFPQEWNRSFEYIHEVWTVSEFAKDSIAQAAQTHSIHVTNMPSVVEPELNSQYNRAHFNLPEDTFIFLFTFDGMSFADRKNPFATAKAYAKSFSQNDDTLLLIKTQNLDKGHLKKLEKILKGTKYQIINRYLSRDEIIGLINSIDCYVSLHRSEGFGYGLAEAMYLKKIVIGTNYSGNLDFMDNSNSFLVPYTLIEITKDIGPYTKGNHWADANVEKASEIMKEVYKSRDTEQVKTKRNKAYETIHNLYSVKRVSDAVHTHLTQRI